MLNLNPVLKRFLKGLLATMGAAGIGYIVNVIPHTGLVPVAIWGLIASFLLALEKWLESTSLETNL